MDYNTDQRGDLDLIALIYQGALGRIPDASGLAYWAGELASGKSPVLVAQAIMSSSEYLTAHANEPDSISIGFFYQNILGRFPTAQDINYWTTNAGGKAFDLVAIAQSEEAQQHNENGLHRFENAAINNTLTESKSAHFDNSAMDKTIVVQVPVNVPVPVDQPDPVFSINGTLDEPAATPGGTQKFGDLTTPARDINSGEIDGSLVYFSLRPRQSDQAWSPDEGLVSGNTLTVTYHTPTGSQSVAYGSQANVANRPVTAENFGVASTDGNTLAQDIASGISYHLFLDGDGSAAVNGQHYILGDANGVGQLDWVNQTIAGADILDNGGDAFAVANSTVISFHAPGGMAAVAGPGQYTSSLYVEDNGVQIVGVTVNHFLTANAADFSYRHVA